MSASITFTNEKSINWSGYTWYLRDESNSGPGPNNWTSQNVFVDSANHLHLKIKNSGSGWTCAELYSADKFGFGSYRWFIEGGIDKFDPNIVLGLFTYGGQDFINEIDIEAAKWGKADSNAGNLFFTIYPRSFGSKPTNKGTRISLDGTYTTHRFTWTKKNVQLQSQAGFQESPGKNVILKYTTPSSFTPIMPIASVPLHINLWLFQGRSPTNGREVEIIIHSFKYTRQVEDIHFNETLKSFGPRLV